MSIRLPRGVKRLRDGRWRVRAYVKDERTGKDRETQRTYPKKLTLADVLVAREALVEELQAGERPAPRAQTTLAVYSEQWLEAKAARLRPSTASIYATDLATRVLPELGEFYVDTITRADVERWVGWAERERMENGQPYARATLQRWWRVTKQILRDAAADYGMPDPTLRVRGPKGIGGSRREKRTLTATELGSLLSAMEALYPDRYAELYVLAYTGMRAGELYALRWSDLDEERGCIHVRRSHWHGHESTTKTDDPRDVALPKAMVEVLRQHRRRLVAAQHPGLKQGLVFPAAHGGFRILQTLAKPLKRAARLTEIEVSVCPQVLRRTFNTLMVAQGVDRIVLRSQMGHSSEEMTERYAGIGLEEKLAAVERLVQVSSVTPTGS